jgi:hypothetical protein
VDVGTIGNLTRVAVLAVVVTACGGSGSGDGGSVSSPCDLADAALVGQHFTGTVAAGVEGEARNCSFDIEGGDVLSVTVFYFGDASGWDGTRDGYVENRGGVTDIDGLADEAFYPNDAGEGELVVQAGGEIFSVSVFNFLSDPLPTALESLQSLARSIADDLSAG